jgi:hypothetical protein
MKSFTPMLLLMVGILATGCFYHHRRPMPVAAPTAATASPAANPSTNAPRPIVMPGTSLSGKVVSCNDVGRFVVLNFPVGHMPAVGQNLFLYRNGLKVAEIKVTGPQRDENIVADIVSGDAQAGDEVRNQ